MRTLTGNTVIKLNQIKDLSQWHNLICDTHVEYTRSNGTHVVYERKSGKRKEEENRKDQQGSFIKKVSSISNIKDEDFITPSKSFLLPNINKKFSTAIHKENKAVLLSKHTIERMAKEHPEMKDGKNRKQILLNALNNFTNVLYCRPKKKPNYYTFVKNGKYYDMSVIDTDKNKKYFEIVAWRRIDEEGYQSMLKKMEREDGQFLITDGRTSTGRLTFPLFRSNCNTTI